MASAYEMTDVSTAPAKRPSLAKASFTVDIAGDTKDLKADGAKKGRFAAWWAGLKRWQKACIILSIIGLLVLIIALLAVYVIAPAVAQSSVDNAVFVMTALQMSNPTANTVMVQCTSVVHNAGSLAATVEPALVAVTYLGVPFALLPMPEISIQANKPATAFINAPMTVTNDAVFRAAATQLLAGNDVLWGFVGRLTVKASLGVTLSMRVNMNKLVLIPGIDIAQSTAYNVQIVGGDTAGVLNTTVAQTFITTSINTMMNVGLVQFALLGYTTPNVTSAPVNIGLVTIDNFAVNTGFNQFDAVKVDLIQTDEASRKAIRLLLSNYNTGKDTPLRIVGPIVCASPFFINTSTIATVLKGAEMHTLAVAANINLGSVAQEGVYLTAYNPYNKAVSQSDMVFQVSTDVPIPAYTYRSLTTTIVCPETHAFSTLYQKPGTSFSIPAQGMTTQLLNLLPAEGQSLECFLSAPQAVMCLAAAAGQFAFEVSTAGTMDIRFGQFSSTIDYAQPLSPTFFESLVHMAAAAQYQCAGYNFTANPEYTPILRTCATNANGTAEQLVSVVPAGTISPVESEWLQARLANINAPKVQPSGNNASDWHEYLNGLGLAGLDVEATTLPVIAIAASGGGYKAMFNTAGVLSALDARNPAAVANGTGGLLQSSAYLAGLSGGGWMVGSMYNHDFAPAEDIVRAFGNFSFWKPHADDGALGIAEGWGDTIFRVANKKFAGFNVSLTDLWGQMLAQQMMADENMRLSDLASRDPVALHAAPLPILTSAQVYPNDPNGTTNVWTWSPFDSEIAGIGATSGNVGLTATFNPSVLGTSMNNARPVDANTCVRNMDNLGYIVGMESAAFEVSVANIFAVLCSSELGKLMSVSSSTAKTLCTEATLFMQQQINGEQVCVALFTSGILGSSLPPSVISFIEKYLCYPFSALTTTEAFMAALQLALPTLQTMAKDVCPLLASAEDCQKLSAQLEWLQNNFATVDKIAVAVSNFIGKYGNIRPVPPATVANPFYGIPSVAAADSRLATAPQIGAIDGWFAGQQNVPFWPVLQAGRGVQFIVAIDSYADGGALINGASFASSHGVAFPAVPTTLSEYQKNNASLLHKVTLFGCGQSGVPTVAYVPWRKVAGIYDGPDPNVLQLEYNQPQIQGLGLNGFAQVTGFVDQPNLPQALGCAALAAAGNTLPQGCTDINWTSFCWQP